MTSIGWIDFSSEHRDKVRTVLDLLRQRGVVDELGIGMIRDAFADRLFPGISTIQTRAKYFLLTARLIDDYAALPEAKKAKQTLEEFLAHWEKWCRIQLARRYGEAGEGLGIIGISFGELSHVDVQRQPSSVYWTGLRTFGLVRTRLSLAEFGRQLGGRRSLKTILEETPRLAGDDADADPESGPPVVVPEIDDEYWDDLAVTLTTREAEFLRQQITARVPDSLLGQILLDDRAAGQLIRLKHSATFAEFAELPFIRGLKHPELNKAVCHARDFWTLLEGAHIRYNLLLEKRFGTRDGVEECEGYWHAWREELDRFDWSRWEDNFVWDVVLQRGSNVPWFTRDFVNGWIAHARAGAADFQACDRLVIDQERANKASRARLRPDAKDVQIDGWVGLSTLDYRLPQVKTIVTDIIRGENGEADPDVGR